MRVPGRTEHGVFRRSSHGVFGGGGPSGWFWAVMVTGADAALYSEFPRSGVLPIETVNFSVTGETLSYGASSSQTGWFGGVKLGEVFGMQLDSGDYVAWKPYDPEFPLSGEVGVGELACVNFGQSLQSGLGFDFVDWVGENASYGAGVYVAYDELGRLIFSRDLSYNGVGTGKAQLRCYQANSAYVTSSTIYRLAPDFIRGDQPGGGNPFHFFDRLNFTATRSYGLTTSQNFSGYGGLFNRFADVNGDNYSLAGLLDIRVFSDSGLGNDGGPISFSGSIKLVVNNGEFDVNNSEITGIYSAPETSLSYTVTGDYGVDTTPFSTRFNWTVNMETSSIYNELTYNFDNEALRTFLTVSQGWFGADIESPYWRRQDGGEFAFTAARERTETQSGSTEDVVPGSGNGIFGFTEVSNITGSELVRSIIRYSGYVGAGSTLVDEEWVENVFEL